MKFDEVAWGAVCFYYRSVGDNKYSRIMRDTEFLSKLRKAPIEVNLAEFERKVILDYINIESYDLLVGQRFASKILAKIVDLQPELTSLVDMSLTDCDLSSSKLVDKIARVYDMLYSVNGLWLTGVSKIAHILNDRLFPLINLEISDYFKIIDGRNGLVQWLKVTQQAAREVIADFDKQKLADSPEQFLSDKLGYTERSHQKSLIKFIDEYLWLCFGDHLPVPPKWIPDFNVQVGQYHEEQPLLSNEAGNSEGKQKPRKRAKGLRSR